MRFVRTLIALSLALVVVSGLSGCSSSDGSSSSSLRPFVGAWNGTFASTPTGSTQVQSGAIEINVAANGNITGILENTTTSDRASLTGVLTPDNKKVTINGTLLYTATEAFQVAGVLDLQPNNHLTGTIFAYDTQRRLVSSTVVDIARS